MLVCYLDDSDKDPQNPITTPAGYVASEEQWKAFEPEVETWFEEFNVGIFTRRICTTRAGNLGDGEFTPISRAVWCRKPFRMTVGTIFEASHYSPRSRAAEAMSWPSFANASLTSNANRGPN